MTRGSSSRLLVPGEWLAVAALFLAGCSGIGIQASVLGAPAPDDDSATPKGSIDGGTTGVDASMHFDTNEGGDAGAGTKPGPSGYSPLCKMALAGGCDPDDWACVASPSAMAEGGVDSDAEAAAPVCPGGSDMRPCADGDQAVACRVGSGGPVCSGTDNYTADARTGTPCKQSSECDIGYECVSAEEPGDGTCKPYCCDSTVCAALPAQAGSPVPFCDIENPISGVPSTGVPVCTAGPACTPLQTGACGAGMTCTVVSPSGQTACVTVGKAMEHQDCTTEKCGPNLACIVGTCVQLCDTGGTNTCPPYELCVAPTAFGSDSLIGVCTR